MCGEVCVGPRLVRAQSAERPECHLRTRGHRRAIPPVRGSRAPMMSRPGKCTTLSQLQCAHNVIILFRSAPLNSYERSVVLGREEDAMRQQLLGRVLCKEAYARLGYVQSVDPQRARVIENKIVGMARSGQILKELTDTQLTRIMEGIKETRSVTHSQIKYERRSSLLDTLGLDPAYASKLGVEIEGWDSPVAEKENSLSESLSPQAPPPISPFPAPQPTLLLAFNQQPHSPGWQNTLAPCHAHTYPVLPESRVA